jgi:hypothetical protein
MREIGESVGRAVQGRPYSPSTAWAWFEGSIPPLDVIPALANLLEVERDWLAFGKGEPPPGWVTRDPDAEQAIVELGEIADRDEEA